MKRTGKQPRRVIREQQLDLLPSEPKLAPGQIKIKMEQHQKAALKKSKGNKRGQV